MGTKHFNNFTDFSQRPPHKRQPTIGVFHNKTIALVITGASACGLFLQACGRFSLMRFNI